eukprot:gb/GECG01002401.1/.p1 GENE.gb/GECG01002401.1/~~gb/GECG01002401.1/.p1  ORF type:complete len:107 (+),score=13.88 gb/GECG01002401.1/:1-321(+)
MPFLPVSMHPEEKRLDCVCTAIFKDPSPPAKQQFGQPFKNYLLKRQEFQYQEAQRRERERVLKSSQIRGGFARGMVSVSGSRWNLITVPWLLSEREMKIGGSRESN